MSVRPSKEAAGPGGGWGWVLTEGSIVGDDVHLGEHVDVRHFELEHGAKGEEQDRDVFRGVGQVRRV